MPTLVQTLKTVDTIQDAWEAGNSEQLGAGIAKLTAMLAVGIAAEAMIRSGWPLIRLGYALTGRIDQWEKISAFGRWLAAEITGSAIDAISSLDLGLALYDLMHAEELTNTDFTAAARFVARVLFDPLTLDLDADGLETTGISTTSPIYFDHTGSGIRTATGWLRPDDAFLVLDRNGNGLIDSGRELFGDSTIKRDGQRAADGFDALRDLDSNADGKISALDARFAELRLWRDLNQDGVSQSNELFTLGQLNVASINVSASAHRQTLANGNQIADLGTYTRSDGRVSKRVRLGEHTRQQAKSKKQDLTPWRET